MGVVVVVVAASATWMDDDVTMIMSGTASSLMSVWKSLEREVGRAKRGVKRGVGGVWKAKVPLLPGYQMREEVVVV